MPVTSNAGLWQLDELHAEIVAALDGDHASEASMIDGRVVAVKASPEQENATRIVMGMAALPPRYRTPPHSHEAEEIAVFIAGRGRVDIEGAMYPVGPGSILLTPSGNEHTTYSDDENDPLVVLWFYSPPGSERRWMPDKPGVQRP